MAHSQHSDDPEQDPSGKQGEQREQREEEDADLMGRAHLDALMSDFEQAWLPSKDLRIFLRENAVPVSLGVLLVGALLGGTVVSSRNRRRRALRARLKHYGALVGRAAVDSGGAAKGEGSVLAEALAAGVTSFTRVLVRRLLATRAR